MSLLKIMRKKLSGLANLARYDKYQPTPWDLILCTYRQVTSKNGAYTVTISMSQGEHCLKDTPWLLSEGEDPLDPPGRVAAVFKLYSVCKVPPCDTNLLLEKGD